MRDKSESGRGTAGRHAGFNDMQRRERSRGRDEYSNCTKCDDVFGKKVGLEANKETKMQKKRVEKGHVEGCNKAIRNDVSTIAAAERGRI